MIDQLKLPRAVLAHFTVQHPGILPKEAEL